MSLKANKYTTLTTTLSAGAASATLTSASFDNGTQVPLIVDYDNTSKLEVILADISGTSLTNIIRGQDGTSDIEHTGTPKICQGPVPSSITYDFNNRSTTLGYAAATASQTSITTVADLTNLSVAVTVPTGGRRVRITGYVQANSSAAADIIQMSIQEGSTVLATSYLGVVKASYSCCLISSAVITPTAGAHTYKLTMGRTFGTGNLTMEAASISPAYILVELI